MHASDISVNIEHEQHVDRVSSDDSSWPWEELFPVCWWTPRDVPSQPAERRAQQHVLDGVSAIEAMQ